ncbi:restriction endonuclease subunit S [Glutamicibacter sp. M10]|uniref:restriction endonuclease subunit S n=1 Tax=Glutamicibacter sp. M10 TaxID=3023076 RepID=UPI0021C66847|nr:restriction endonuclease subunit S [Glutamicibacter sp. M10]UXN33352.1 restriction endonuclease subunit S [Glutamicibacter sp. M10]
MSRIDELIATHCPNGVPYMGVTEVADYIRGITYNKGDEELNGPRRVLRANNITLSSNTLNLDNLKHVSESVRVRDNQRLHAGDILICAGSGSKDHIGKVAYIFRDMEETFGGFMGVIRSKGKLDARYLFHILTSDLFLGYLRGALSTTTINNLNSRVMKGFVIPVPPLEIQREIVGILDAFSKMEAELEAELEVELEARKQQYEHYRRMLLTEVEATGSLAELGELGRIVTGRTPKASDTSSWGEDVDFITPSDIKNGMKSVSIPVRRLSKSGADSLSKAIVPARSLLVTCIGADMGKTVINENKCATNQQINSITLNSGIDTDFVFHVLTSMRGKIRAQGERAGGTMPIINKSDFSKIKISLPTLLEQKRIAAILNNFDALVNDLHRALPAELAARRQQYEYYRDKLLSFREDV